MHGTIIMGLVGKIGSGKSTFTNILIEFAEQQGLSVSRIKFSDILLETLNLWNLTANRENLQKMAVAMDNFFGKGTLSKAVEGRILEAGERVDIVVVDGVRWQSDVEMLRYLQRDAMLIYINTTQNIRYQRVRSRKEKSGENGLSFSQFCIDDKAPNEKFIEEIGALSDIEIENNGSLEDFRAKTEENLALMRFSLLLSRLI